MRISLVSARSRLIILLITLSLLPMIWILSSCPPLAPADKYTGAVFVEDSPNTFEALPARWGEKVLGIKVWENYYTPSKQLVWHIKATRPIKAKGFVITVGALPESFEQVVPSPKETFHPTPGKKYAVSIETNLVVGAPPPPTPWVAQ